MKNRCVCILLLFCFGIKTAGQNPITFIVKTEGDDNAMVQYAIVKTNALPESTLTNEDGLFYVDPNGLSRINLQISALGYVSLDTVVFAKDGIIFLRKNTIHLNEVEIVAREKYRNVSGTMLSRKAIEHIQPLDIGDVMQLQPGMATENPTLSSPKYLKIRSTINERLSGSDQIEAMGVLLMVDGQRVSNDANMQLNSFTNGKKPIYSSSALSGVDVRRVSTDNIESIEIIRGIPTSDYGEMSTGAVLVQTQSGKQPWALSLKSDITTRHISLSKGFETNHKTKYNFMAGISESVVDMREPQNAFRRYFLNQKVQTNTTLWGITMFSNNHLDTWFSIDKYNVGQNEVQIKSASSETTGFSFGTDDMVHVKKWWANNIRLTANITVANALSQSISTLSNGEVRPTSISLSPGLSEGIYAPSSFYAKNRVEGLPVDVSVKLKADAVYGFWGLNHIFTYGLEYLGEKNFGSGTHFDMKTNPNINSVASVRPRRFSDIPFLHNTGAFISNKSMVKLGAFNASLDIGMRYTQLYLDKYRRNGLSALSPRGNIALSTNNHLWPDKCLSVTLGVGRLSKMPSLIFLAPEPLWIDNVSYNFYQSNGPTLCVFDSKKIDQTWNPDLKVTMNLKREIGINFKLKNSDYNVTFFKENLSNGYGSEKVYFPVTSQKFSTPAGPNITPYLENSFVKYSMDGVIREAKQWVDTSFAYYYKPTNQMAIDKKGIEFSLRFPEIIPIGCRFYIVGGYLYTQSRNLVHDVYYPVLTYAGKAMPVFAVYPLGEMVESDQLVTNILTTIRFNNNKLLFSLTSQIVWFDRYRYKYQDATGKIQIKTESPVSGSIYDDNIQKKYLYPQYYVDFGNNKQVFDVNNQANVLPFSNLINIFMPGYFLQESYPPVVQFNARLNRQVGKNLGIAIFANNIFNYLRYDISKRSGSYYRRNTPLYFGSEIKWSFN